MVWLMNLRMGSVMMLMLGMDPNQGSRHASIEVSWDRLSVLSLAPNECTGGVDERVHVVVLVASVVDDDDIVR